MSFSKKALVRSTLEVIRTSQDAAVAEAQLRRLYTMNVPEKDLRPAVAKVRALKDRAAAFAAARASVAPEESK